MTWSDELRHQYAAATTKARLIRLPRWSTLAVSGRDRAAFLHNMCTNDIRRLAPGDQCEAFLTDVKGKIVGHVIVMATDETLLLVGVPGTAETLAGHLDRYIIREDVQLADVSATHEWFLWIGPDAVWVGDARAEPLAGSKRLNWSFDLAKATLWPGGRWSWKLPVHGPAPSPVDDLVWHALRVESGWPLFGVDFDGSNLPQEVGRDAQAISFRKGCYLGQETVARIDALGHVNKRLGTVRLGGEAAAGDELFAGGESVGRVTSASYSPRLNGWLAMAMVRRGHNEPGAQIACRDRPAEVIATPAVRFAQD
jgi:folate-binding protein YgfZ